MEISITHIKKINDKYYSIISLNHLDPNESIINKVINSDNYFIFVVVIFQTLLNEHVEQFVDDIVRFDQ